MNTELYKVVGVLKWGLYCSTIIEKSHPLSARYRIGKRTRGKFGTALMAFMRLRDALDFMNNRNLYHSTYEQAVLECSGESCRGVLLAMDLLHNNEGLASLIAGRAYHMDCSDRAPSGTVMCSELTPRREVARCTGNHSGERENPGQVLPLTREVWRSRMRIIKMLAADLISRT
jgi:hypothetical protein